jgi:hypothetical protein
MSVHPLNRFGKMLRCVGPPKTFEPASSSCCELSSKAPVCFDPREQARDTLDVFRGTSERSIAGDLGQAGRVAA